MHSWPVFLLQLLLVHGLPQADNAAPVRLLYEYPVGTWIENIAVRSNGDLLLTVLNVPHLDQVSPYKANATPETIHSFPNALSVFGIAEIAPDVFAMAVGNFTLTGGVQPGSFSIWSVSFTMHDTMEAHKIADLPQATFLNGLCSLPGTGSPKDFLVGDIKQGLIYYVDTSTGDYGVAINNSFTAAVSDPVFGTAGVNGMHVHDGDLFFTNTGQALFAKMHIHTSGTPAGEPTIVARVLNSSMEFDDFAIKDNDAYLVTGSGNSIERVGLEGTSKGRIVAGSLNSTQFAEPTSCAFGRTEADRHILYVVTAGGLATPVDGDVTVGAQVLAVDTRLWLS
ncbi:hypothetical protein LTR97_002758 [Elasticomyces elasticus]|uniref:SMP-30/Gluconolactonase/LRE-like region domain-containing protein n=1 Tax=Elasticomyces elasticus TaxID=574655 RepID=A0AAN7WA06_9PEZI|nr:hypothetical protein LTR97_002758 [Elasticomyces elasticus]